MNIVLQWKAHFRRIEGINSRTPGRMPHRRVLCPKYWTQLRIGQARPSSPSENCRTAGSLCYFLFSMAYCSAYDSIVSFPSACAVRLWAPTDSRLLLWVGCAAQSQSVHAGRVLGTRSVPEYHCLKCSFTLSTLQSTLNSKNEPLFQIDPYLFPI